LICSVEARHRPCKW